MPFRKFRRRLDDGPRFAMRYVELNQDGRVVAWQADPVVEWEGAVDDIFKLLDEMRSGAMEPTIDEDVLWNMWDESVEIVDD